MSTLSPGASSSHRIQNKIQLTPSVVRVTINTPGGFFYINEQNSAAPHTSYIPRRNNKKIGTLVSPGMVVESWRKRSIGRHDGKGSLGYFNHGSWSSFCQRWCLGTGRLWSSRPERTQGGETACISQVLWSRKKPLRAKASERSGESDDHIVVCDTLSSAVTKSARVTSHRVSSPCTAAFLPTRDIWSIRFALVSNQ